MLSHNYRFHGHGSLRYLYRNGQTVRNRSVLVKYAENKHRRHSRVAVVVGKKVAKSAVKRNRIRRRVFEVIRKHWDALRPHYDISVTIFTAEFVTMSASEVEENILSVLNQAHLITKAPAAPSVTQGSISATLDSNL